VSREVLFGAYEAGRKATRPSLAYCGDDQSGKAVAAGPSRDMGPDPVDANPLWIARDAEPLALLVAQPVYEGIGGPDLA
jgi:predicted dinucleotide-binding enzyme